MKTYEHLPTWKKRLAGNAVGCGFVLLFLFLPILLAGLAIQERIPPLATFYVALAALIGFLFLFERSPFGRRTNAAIRRMGLEAAVEDIEHGVARCLHGRTSARRCWLAHKRLEQRRRSLPFGEASDLQLRFEGALDQLRRTAVEAAPHDPEGAGFDRWLMRYRIFGMVLIAASLLWASIRMARHPEASGLHFLPWLPATAGFALMLRDASVIVRWAGSALFGVMVILLPSLLAEWISLLQK